MELPNVEIKHILYATDDSEDARYAFAYASSLSKQYHAKLTLLHVVPEFPDMVAFDFGIERSLAAKKWFSTKQEYIKKIKKRFEELLEIEYDEKILGIDDIVVEKGNPVKMILWVAKNKECDLIVMGIKGRSPLEDAMMGNTVAGVLRRSKLPVLVLRNKKTK